MERKLDVTDSVRVLNAERRGGKCATVGQAFQPDPNWQDRADRCSSQPGKTDLQFADAGFDLFRRELQHFDAGPI